MVNFKQALDKKVINSLQNKYGIENYDIYRFGDYTASDNQSPVNSYKKNEFSLKRIKKIIKKIIGYHPENKSYLNKVHAYIQPYLEGFEKLWENLNHTDKKLLVSLIAYRILGFKKVKLPRNNTEYWKAIKTAKTLADPNDKYDPHFLHFILEKFNLNPIGFNIQFYFSEIGVAIDFIIEQYAYKLENKTIVQVEENDVVLDVGGCWGDTALYFAHKTGNNGKVYSFEFIPDNIKLFKINTELNPNLLSRIELIPNPVSKNSGDLIYFKDHGPGSTVKFEPFDEQTGTAKTLSIDDFVKSNNLSKVDFIKMDIEGAEPIALEGAIETIKKFRPKLAIATYHSFDDFVNIPNWILNLDLDYEIYMGHYTIHSEETVCFAKPK